MGNKLGLKLVAERHFPADRGDFSLYFLADVEQGELDKLNEKFKDVDEDEKPFKVFKSLWSQMLELTHNHGVRHQILMAKSTSTWTPIRCKSLTVSRLRPKPRSKEKKTASSLIQMATSSTWFVVNK